MKNKIHVPLQNDKYNSLTFKIKGEVISSNQ